MKIIIKVKGESGSGNFDHAGITGQVGGSASNFKSIYYQTAMNVFKEVRF